MKKILKKLNTLLHLDWKWALRYYKKKIKLYCSYFFSKLKRRNYWEVNIEGTKVKLFFNNYYQHHIAKLLAQRDHEGQLLGIWKKQSEEKNVVLDLGGHTGVYGLISAAANPNSKVYIFEPEPVNCRHIKNNIELNGLKNIELIQAAVSDKSGTVLFDAHEGGTGGNIATSGRDIAASEIRVNCWGLDDFFEKREPPTLIKFDVEGAECRVLFGAKHILTNNKPKILLEVHQNFLNRYGDSTKDIDNFLRQMRYEKLWLHQSKVNTHYWVYKNI